MNTELNEILNSDPEKVLSWIKGMISGMEKGLENVNWLGLAQGAALMATTSESGIKTDSLWAKISTHSYNYLAMHASDQSVNSFETSSMNMCVVLILRYGNVKDDEILDVERIRSWFFSRNELSFSEVKNILTGNNTPGIDVLRKLRNIKNRMNIVDSLIEAGYFKDDAILKEWINIKTLLP